MWFVWLLGFAEEAEPAEDAGFDGCVTWLAALDDDLVDDELGEIL